MRVLSVVLSLILLCGCQLLEPSYVEVTPETLEVVVQRLGGDLEGLLSTNREALRAELTKELGLQVQKVYAEVEQQGEDLTVLKSLTAEIRPATDAAIESLTSAVVKDPTEPVNWFRGAIAGGGVLLAGLLGFRGSRKRKNGQVGSSSGVG